MVHPTRFELMTSAFGGQRSIQLSYGCLRRTLAFRALDRKPRFMFSVHLLSGSIRSII